MQVACQIFCNLTFTHSRGLSYDFSNIALSELKKVKVTKHTLTPFHGECKAFEAAFNILKEELATTKNYGKCFEDMVKAVENGK
jgi:pimeloyl-CoA synthetase